MDFGGGRGLVRELEKQRRLRVCHSSIPVSLVEADILC